MFRLLCPALSGLLLLASFFACGEAHAASSEGPIRILFLGDQGSHNPSDRLHQLRKALGPDAIYFDYTEDVGDLNLDNLRQYDGLMIFANITQLPKASEEAMLAYVAEGHGLLPIHSASYCFHNSDAYIKLVGAQFRSHGWERMTTEIVDDTHPITRGLETFESLDETYVHHRHNPDKHVLSVREEDGHREPWTWVREHGKGRVFYTAWGHDENTWGHEGFHELIKRGTLWAVGEKAAADWKKFVESRKELTYERRDNIPNYENRPEPLKYQHPLSPEESMQYIQVPVGMELKLFAAEPDIVNPIYMAWDEKGRLWVAESVDYPNEVNDNMEGRDRIKICEDTDGDGRADKFTVFADNLNIPTSFTFANGGVIVSMAPHFYFLKDTDGDDKADETKILLSGWGRGDTHAGPSNLRWGHDNWVYGAVGYSAFNGEVGGERHRFTMGVYRFKPDGSEIDYLGQFTNNTWGLGLNEAGDVFGGTANNAPSFYVGIPKRLFPGGDGNGAKKINDFYYMHPVTANIRQVDVFEGYTAAAGHAFYTARTYPESYWDTAAFICEPTGHLIGQAKVLPDGAGYVAKDDFTIMASADEWVSPVVAEVGPDGNLWVADWYEFIVQHNPTPSPGRGGYRARTGEGNAHVNPNRDRQHGRIYRIVPKGAEEAETPDLSNADETALIAALGHPNMFWRLTAQRLLVEKGGIDDFRNLIVADADREPMKALHSLRVLQGYGHFSVDRWNSIEAGLKNAGFDLATFAAQSDVERAAKFPFAYAFDLLGAESPAIRKNAIEVLPPNRQALEGLVAHGLLVDSDLNVRLHAFRKLLEMEAIPELEGLVQNAWSNPANRDDAWLSDVLKLLARKNGVQFKSREGKNLLPNPSFELTEGDGPADWRVRTYGGPAEHRLVRGGRTGDYALQISSDSGSDTSWYVDVPVKRNTQYKLSGWVKTDGVERAMGGLMNVHGLGQEMTTNAISGDSDWEPVELIFNSGGRDEVSVNLLFGGWGRARGVAYYDDVALREMTFGPPEEEGVLSGDPSRGQELFNTHPVASCIRCHKLGGNGGVIGPALDGIAARKSREYILESMLDPNATMAEGYQNVVSPMPPMKVILSPQELEDIMAFIMTLETERDVGAGAQNAGAE